MHGVIETFNLVQETAESALLLLFAHAAAARRPGLDGRGGGGGLKRVRVERVQVRGRRGSGRARHTTAARVSVCRYPHTVLQ